ncbi:MAG: mechanosensitive ion channel family protein [Patescibacteria group bacterium]|nr:mechanosensitive ion channel family protein [Patescibacteria group bacterium]
MELFSKLSLRTILLDKPLKILFILLGMILFNLILRRLVAFPKNIDAKRAKTLLSIIQSAVSIAIFILGIMLILSVLEINITPFLASAGIIGLAIGFGSQVVIKDLIAGLFLLAEDTVAIGDLVEIGNSRGIVEKISLRTIILRDEDGALHIIPAGQITKVINISRREARINIELPVNPAFSIDKLYKILREEIKNLSEDKRFGKLLTKKAEFKGLEDIQPSKIVLKIVFYSRTNDQWRIKREFLYRVKKRFEKEALNFA